MKRIHRYPLWVVIAMCLTMTVNAQAQPNRHSAATRQTDRPANQLEFGIDAYHFDYQEDLTAPQKSTESGWIPAIYVSHMYRRPWALMSRLLFEYASTDVDYDGSTQSGVPVRDTSSAQFYTAEVNIGYTFETGGGVLISPYVGYGYRYWSRGLGGTTPYDEIYKWQYVPVGVIALFDLGPGVTVAPHLGYRHMVDGTMDIQFANPNYNQPQLDLGDMPGWLLEAPVTWQIADRMALVTTPWCERYEFGRSQWQPLTFAGASVGQVREPASETVLYGVRISLAFQF